MAIGSRSPLLCFFLQRVYVRLHIFMAGCYRCVLILGFLVSAIMRCFSTALLMTLAVAQDPAEGWMAYAISSLPSSVERVTRLEMTWTVGQAPTWSWAFFPPWFGMDPADNLNLTQPVNHWSGRAWSMYTEYYQWSEEHKSNSRSYTVQAGQTLHGALVYSAADDSYTLSQTVVETGETSSQVVQCQSGKKFVVPYVVYERVFSCYTFPGDGKVSFRNVIVECDGTDCTLLQHTPRLGPYHRFSLLRKQPWSPLQVPWWFLLQRCRIPCAFQPSAQHLSWLRHQWQLSHRA